MTKPENGDFRSKIWEKMLEVMLHSLATKLMAGAGAILVIISSIAFALLRGNEGRCYVGPPMSCAAAPHIESWMRSVLLITGNIVYFSPGGGGVTYRGKITDGDHPNGMIATLYTADDNEVGSLTIEFDNVDQNIVEVRWGSRKDDLPVTRHMAVVGFSESIVGARPAGPTSHVMTRKSGDGL